MSIVPFIFRWFNYNGVLDIPIILTNLCRTSSCLRVKRHDSFGVSEKEGFLGIEWIPTIAGWQNTCFTKAVYFKWVLCSLPNQRCFTHTTIVCLWCVQVLLREYVLTNVYVLYNVCNFDIVSFDQQLVYTFYNCDTFRVAIWSTRLYVLKPDK